MLKNKLYIVLAIASLPLFYLVVQYSGITDKAQLTSRTWHSDMNVLISETKFEQPLDGMSRIERISVSSDFRYLNDKSFIQESVVKAYDDNNSFMFSMDISNVGEWDYQQGYLFLQAGDIQELSSVTNEYIDKESLTKFREMFLVYMFQARRMDRINKDIMLMTSVDGTSRLWVAR